MHSLSTLDPQRWESEKLQDSPAYAAGNALGWLYKGNKQASVSHAFSGRLYLSQSNWLLLSVPNAFVRGLFDAMTTPGAELPTKGVWGPDADKPDLLNAHISVMTAEEVEQIGADKINERGHTFHYSLGKLEEVTPKSGNVSKAWIMTVTAPGLTALRKSYGLSPMLNDDHQFHITIAVRRKNVLRNNAMSKGNATDDDMPVQATSRGELKAAAVYNFEGDVQGVSLRKTLHQILDELKHPGLAYNNAYTGEARAIIPGNKKHQEEILSALRKRLAERVAANSPEGVPYKSKQPLQEGVDYSITPLPKQRERMHPVTMTSDDVQNFVRSQGFDRLGAEHADYQKQWLGERYRLTPDATGNLVGAVPGLAKKQLFGGEPIYGYQTVPGWKDTKTAAASQLSRTGQKDLLHGGKADNVPDREFSPKSLAEGKEDEREHTDNDQIAKEIAKDHLSQDPRYYAKEKLIEKMARPQIIEELLAAKHHSDNKRYGHKAQILKKLMEQSPQDWQIDDSAPKFKGITHTPTKFRFHTDPTIIPAGVKAASSVYLDQARQHLLSPAGLSYDHTKPVFENIRGQLATIKSRGDFMLQAQRNNQIYRASLDPNYRYQLAMQAFHGQMPQPSMQDQLIERYGNSFLNMGR